MATVVQLSTEIIHKYIVELRYEFGHVYWDRAGRIAREFLSSEEGWDFNTIDIKHCQLSLRDKNLTFNYGPGKLDLSQNQSSEVDTLIPVGEFGAIAEAASTAVVKHLELELFTRLGFRVWHLIASTRIR